MLLTKMTKPMEAEEVDSSHSVMRRKVDQMIPEDYHWIYKNDSSIMMSMDWCEHQLVRNHSLDSGPERNGFWCEDSVLNRCRARFHRELSTNKEDRMD